MLLDVTVLQPDAGAEERASAEVCGKGYWHGLGCRLQGSLCGLCLSLSPSASLCAPCVCAGVFIMCMWVLVGVFLCVHLDMEELQVYVGVCVCAYMCVCVCVQTVHA